MSVNINDLLARAAALRDETALNSISPDRAGGIMYDTLLAMNELWLQQGSALVISKIYASVAAMEADSAPVSDLTGQLLRPGQIVVIASSDEDNGSVYRYDGTEDDTSSWSPVGNIGDQYVNVVDNVLYVGSEAKGKVPTDIIDGLNSEDATSALAASQGKAIKEMLGEDIDDSSFLRIVLDKNGRILYGVRQSGDFVFGAGVPSVIRDYVQNGLADKVDKALGKSLIESEFADGVRIVESSDILEAKLDKNGRIIEILKTDGSKIINFDVTVNGNIQSAAAGIEARYSNEFLSAILDKNGRVISGIYKDGSAYPKQDQAIIPQYKKLLDAMKDDCYKPFLLGSQLVKANTESYDKNLGEHDTFLPEKLVNQFNYVGLGGKLPHMKEGILQKVMINNEQATILYMGTYIYAMTSVANVVYRLPYSKLAVITESNTAIDAISVDCGTDMLVEGVFETNDGNFIVQAVNNNSSSEDYERRSLYKVTLDDSLHTSVSFLFKCVNSVSNIVGVREQWSFKQYGQKILLSPYGAGKTGQVWWSEDYGNSFECIFNIADDTTYVATKPDGVGGYGAYGIHPVPADLIPPQGNLFWENVSSIGNGSHHVHSCCFDEEFERIWLVTGDDKYLVTGIYWSDDFGKTWHRKGLSWSYPDIDMGGTTQMLQVVSLKNCVLFGTDGWGNGIFRYNRGVKSEEPEIEFVFGWTEDHTNLLGVANHNIVTRDGVMLMVFAPNTPDVLPRGGVVASDGYHFRKVYLDNFSDGETLSSMKIGWPSFLSLRGEDLYIRTKLKNEIIFIENFNN